MTKSRRDDSLRQTRRFIEAVTLLEGQTRVQDLRGWDLDELRREIQLGMDQLDRGEGTLVTEANLDEFIQGIEARGRMHLKRENAHLSAE